MKKNVMLIIASLVKGGAEKSIVNLANELSKNYNVYIVVSRKRDVILNDNIKVITINELQSHKIESILILRKLKKELNIDVSISYTTLYNFYNALSRYHDKTIISVRNYLSKKKEPRPYNFYHRVALKICDRVVCCSKAVMYDQITNYKCNKDKIRVIENFCDKDDIFKSLDDKFSCRERKYISDNLVVITARLVPVKNHIHLINAMKLVVSQVPDARLIIIGTGPLYDELKSLVHSYNLEWNIIFLGYVKNAYKYLKYAKCFVLPSNYEGFSNSIIEAMTCGVPIVASDCYGGNMETLSNDVDYSSKTSKLINCDYGIIVPSFYNKDDDDKNERILADAILSILTNKDLYNYYHKKSLMRIKCYDSSVIIDKWINLIEE